MNDRIVEARDRLHEWTRSKARLLELEAECGRLSARMRTLAERLSREQHDVDRLEGMSLSAIFHALLGDKPETLLEEKRQLLYAKLKYDETVAELDETESERDAVRARLTELDGAQATLEQVLCSENERLSAEDGPDAERLRAIRAEEEGLTVARREADEAEFAASRATSGLTRVLESLASARGLGYFDLMGGGLIATGAKHARLDVARNQLATVQVALRGLERELRDVRRTEDLTVSIDGFLTFADFVFDGLCVDWMVQTRISETRERVRSMATRVAEIGLQLRAERRRIDAELARLQAERRAIVERG